MDETPRREHPSTYIVQDRSNKEEMNRLRLQDTLVTKVMGGVLTEQSDPGRFRRVLDLDVQTHVYTIHYHPGTPEAQAFTENVVRFYKTAVPFLQKWTQVPSDYSTIYQRMVEELQQPDFTATACYFTAWGLSPQKQGKSTLTRDR